jgi:hypothetical protein
MLLKFAVARPTLPRKLIEIANSVEAVQDGLGKGRTVVIAAAPACLARPATCRRKTRRHEYHLDLPPNSTRSPGAISAPKWSREFEGAIGLPDGRKLVTTRPSLSAAY